MATLRKSKVGKHTYWQIVESKRVNGKPRPLVLIHLGTAEQLLYKLKEEPLKWKIKSASHGAVYFLYQIARILNLPYIFNSNFPSQKRDGLTTGETLLIGAIHRSIKPSSKRSFSDWAKTTTLPEIISFEPDKIDSQHFWNQMDMVTEEQMVEAEKQITRKMINLSLIKPELLFYDLTNFFTYINTTNEKSDLAKRGRNKQKRNDLKQFNLAQVVTEEFLIPVLSEVYEGNKTDKEYFIPFLTRFRKRLSEVNLELADITIVFDKGSTTKDNFNELDNKEIPYVASLTSSYHKDLMNIPMSDYQEKDINGKTIKCYRTKKLVWGKERTLLIYLSDKLKQSQIRGLNEAIEKKQLKLKELKDKLNNPKARYRKRDTLSVTINDILKEERCSEIINATIEEKRKGHFDVSWGIDDVAYLWITENLFGKKILVTSRDDWSDERIISAYNGQSNVERVFKSLKNPYHNAVRPQYHWTDQKIKVHTFICVIGLLLSQVLLKKAGELGYKGSIESLIDKLSEIRKVEVITIAEDKKKLDKIVQLEEMNPVLEKMYTDLMKNITG